MAIVDKHSLLARGSESTLVCLHWSPPPIEWIKLNSDNACRASDGSTSYGRVFQDSMGKWLLGFAQFIRLSFGGLFAGAEEHSLEFFPAVGSEELPDVQPPLAVFEEGCAD
ncbi:hypothetical protein V6N13_036689 [Hibiscus sabdariffa]